MLLNQQPWRRLAFDVLEYAGGGWGELLAREKLGCLPTDRTAVVSMVLSKYRYNHSCQTERNASILNRVVCNVSYLD